MQLSRVLTSFYGQERCSCTVQLSPEMEKCGIHRIESHDAVSSKRPYEMFVFFTFVWDFLKMDGISIVSMGSKLKSLIQFFLELLEH